MLNPNRVVDKQLCNHVRQLERSVEQASKPRRFDPRAPRRKSWFPQGMVIRPEAIADAISNSVAVKAVWPARSDTEIWQRRALPPRGTIASEWNATWTACIRAQRRIFLQKRLKNPAPAPSAARANKRIGRLRLRVGSSLFPQSERIRISSCHGRSAQVQVRLGERCSHRAAKRGNHVGLQCRGHEYCRRWFRLQLADHGILNRRCRAGPGFSLLVFNRSSAPVGLRQQC